MKNKFIQLTSGWIPVCVLLLFATALVYGGPGAGPAATHVKHALQAEFPLPIEAGLPKKPALFELRISPRYE
jgi:hypothetical protein